MSNKRYFKEDMEEINNKSDEGFEPIRRNGFIFRHPLIPTYIIKSVCIFETTIEVEMYYPLNFEIETILKCKKEAYDCDLDLLNSKNEIVHSFKYKSCIAEDISFDKFDYADGEPLKINILFKVLK